MNKIYEDIEKSIHYCYHTKNFWAIDIIIANKIAILNLMGEEDEVSEEQHLENFHNRKSMAALCEFYFL
ncbi:hypothetical protein ON021_29360, partial [Microcoleus sp. HI-ES]|nr:hypothetical protein [Microcoleus sp. HI-ES]